MTRIDADAFDAHRACIDALRAELPVIERIAQCIIDALRAGRRVYVFGNGGSAADAQHIAAELVGRFRRNRRPLPVVALTTDTSLLTAVANDFDYAKVFSRQIEALIQPGDVAWALSTSGNSLNVLAGVEAARRRDARVVGFAGRTGGSLRERCDLCLCVPSEDTARIQEGHQLAYHLVCDAVERAFASESG
jgi:D-sedoheptulose 7-phosphate isomerase